MTMPFFDRTRLNDSAMLLWAANKIMPAIGAAHLRESDMGWIIQSDNDDAWSNTYGWVDNDTYDTFTPEERETMQLPAGGRWVQVPWSAK